MAPGFPARRLRSLCHDSGSAQKKGTSKAEQLRLEEELVKTRAAKMKKLNEDFQACGHRWSTGCLLEVNQVDSSRGELNHERNNHFWGD